MKTGQILKVTILATLQCLCCQAGETLSFTASQPQVSHIKHPWTSRSQTQQTLSSLLTSMDERLRNIENVKYTISKWETFFEGLTRRLESLDVRTRAVQIKLDHLEAITQNIVSYELKNDLFTDQLSRKIESNQDRILHKINLSDNRLESLLTKLEGSMEINIDKLESQQININKQLEGVETNINEMKIKFQKLEGNINSTQHTLKENASSGKKTENDTKIMDMIEGIEKYINQTHLWLADQNYIPKNVTNYKDEKSVNYLKEEVTSEANRIGNKVNNMYNDISRKLISMESLLKSVSSSVNQSRIISKGDMFSSLEDQRCSDTIENLMEITIGNLVETVQRKMGDLSHKVETSFHASHSMLMGACHKLSQDRSQLEIKLTLVLEKILETIVNGTTETNKQQVEVLEALKSHNGQVIRTVAHNAKLLNSFSEASSIEHKNLDNTIVDVAVLINQILTYKEDTLDYNENGNDSETDGQLSGSNLQPPDDTNIETSEITTNPPVVNAVVANYSQGVLKILTDIPSSNLDQFENATKSKTDIVKDLSSNRESEKSFLVSLGLLNRSVSMGDLSVIINEPKSKKNLSEENTKTQFNIPKRIEGKEITDGVKNSNANHTQYKGLEQNNSNFVLKLFTLYFKALKGNLSREKFLHEVNPEEPYSSMEELIKYLKEKDIVPPEFIKELDELYKDSDKEENHDFLITQLIDNKEEEPEHPEEYYVEW